MPYAARLRVSVAYRCSLTALPPRLASWRYLRGQRSLLVNFAMATGGYEASGGAPSAAVEEEEEEEEAPEELEEVVELLLVCLSDKDTVVRWAAAKGIGRATWQLERPVRPRGWIAAIRV